MLRPNALICLASNAENVLSQKMKLSGFEGNMAAANDVAGGLGM